MFSYMILMNQKLKIENNLCLNKSHIIHSTKNLCFFPYLNKNNLQLTNILCSHTLIQVIYGLLYYTKILYLKFSYLNKSRT